MNDKDDKDVEVEDGVQRELRFIGPSMEELGLRGLFSIFRVGKKWSDAVPLEALTLSLRHSDAGDDDPFEAVDEAVVLAVAQGALDDMLEMHVGLSYGCASPMPADRRIELRRFLEGMYGRKLQGGEHCVVLYLHVMGLDDASR